MTLLQTVFTVLNKIQPLKIKRGCEVENVKKIIKVAAVAGLLSSTTVQAEGWRFFPVLDGNFPFMPAVAVTAGVMDPEVSGAGANGIYGVELSFLCPLIQPPTNYIRQQVSLTQYDEGDLKLTTLEANLHYRLPITEGLELGFGPGFGVVHADPDNGGTDTELALQLGMGLNYNLNGGMFVGAEARYQWTTESDIGANGENLDNYRVMFKVGKYF